MGFGSLLSFKVDGVPSKLGHYVVDRFRPEKMYIKVPSGKIKVDSDSIEKLLGVPRGEVSFESLERLYQRDENVKAWRARYPGRFVAPTEISLKIQSANDEDCFNFRMDFVMLFLAVLVEGNAQGRCREKILNYLTGDTDFSKLDWCSYIVNAMKACKKNWIPRCHESPFAGPLAILALLYVERIRFRGIPVDASVNAIRFWNMNRLRERQYWEIKHGGFGKGKYKELREFVAEDELEVDGAPSLTEELKELEKIFDEMVKQKSYLHNSIEKLVEAHPDSVEVMVLKAKFETAMFGDHDEVNRQTNKKIENVMNTLPNEFEDGDAWEVDTTAVQDNCEDGNNASEEIMDDEDRAGNSGQKASDSESIESLRIVVQPNEKDDNDVKQEAIIVEAKWVKSFEEVMFEESVSAGRGLEGMEGNVNKAIEETARLVDMEDVSTDVMGNEISVEKALTDGCITAESLDQPKDVNVVGIESETISVKNEYIEL